MLTFCDVFKCQILSHRFFYSAKHAQLAALSLRIWTKPAWGSIDLLSVRDAWTLNLPHTHAPSCLPESFVELKSYNTWICWRSWLKSSGHAKRVLEKFRFFKMTTQQRRKPPVSASLDSGETSSCNIGNLLWKSSQPNKVAGLEQMIHVVKDSTKLPAGAKFGPDLDFLGLNYIISWHTRSGGAALQRVRC